MADAYEVPTVDGAMAQGTVRPPEIIFFRGLDFTEEQYRCNLNVLRFDAHSVWNDSISSIIVISGTWELFEDADYQGRSARFSPGYHRGISGNLPWDSVSSARVVAW